MEEVITQTAFARSVEQGLTSENKYLQSKYFYDEEGSRIFQDIMRMPEYYLTDCEMEIFQAQKQKIYQRFIESGRQFELIELGAGDGLKTKVLLDYFLKQSCDFEYVPIDISGDAVRELVQSVENEFPHLITNGQIGDYFQMLDNMNQNTDFKKIILFLGSNIGNYQEKEANLFFSKLRKVMKDDDSLLIGFDLKKDAQIILDAYNDPHGHTAKFNLNLLNRINIELDADFDLSSFKHQELYNTESGLAKSILKSLKDQNIRIDALNKTFYFEEGETLSMEISQKYDMNMIHEIAANTGFEVVDNFYDRRNYYVNSLWRLKRN